MGAYLRTDTDLLLMTSTEKEAEDLKEEGAAGSAKQSQGEKEKDAEKEAQDLKRLASEALKAMQNKTVMNADSMIKSPSTEILENYNQQPLHVRSRAEQWELPRSVSGNALLQFEGCAKFTLFQSRKFNLQINLGKEMEA
jgi:hypothetical protein